MSKLINIIRYIVITTILCFGINSFGVDKKKSILVSIPPIASIIKMLIGDLGEVEIIQQAGSCPHHHSMKPSEVEKIKKADYIVYIDKDFETYLSPFLATSRAKEVELSSFKNIRIENKNYHIWVDVDIAINILDSMKKFFEAKGFEPNILNKNYLDGKGRLLDLKEKRNFANVIVVGESLYYLLDKSGNQVKYFPEILGLKMYKKLKKILVSQNPLCIIHDEENKLDSLEPYTSLIMLNIEDWGHKNSDLKEFYIDYMDDLYNRLEKRCNSGAVK